MKKPDIFAYLDSFQFLHDYYAYRKLSSEQFSYESWNEQIGFTNRSFLRLAILGKKKVSDHLLQLLSNAMFETKNEKEYFYCLVKYTQSSSQKDRQMFGQKMLQFVRIESKQNYIQDKPEILVAANLPRLLTLLTFKDIYPTSANYARLLGISLEKTEEYLSILENAQLAKSAFVENEKTWQGVSENFDIAGSRGSEWMMNFHRESLLDAINAFYQPKEQRAYRSFFFPMNQSEFEEFNSAYEEFLSAQRIRLNANSLAGRKLYQVNHNIHVIAEDKKEVAL